MSKSDSSQSIGIFDSGFGGLTVLRELINILPEESYTYLGDSARLPYGTKSEETIRRYLEQNIDFLTEQGVKAIVVACNSASSVLTQKDNFKIPVIGVISPGALAAKESTQNGKIGIIGTKATVSGKAYENAIKTLDASIEVHQQACPLFVPLVEEGLEDDPLTNLIVHRYLNPLLLTDIDTLVLGCTHYPVLMRSINKVVRGKINVIDSAHSVAKVVYEKVLGGEIEKSNSEQAHLRIMATDTASSFLSVAERIMDPIKIDSIEHVDPF